MSERCLSDAQARDAADPLRALRPRFAAPRARCGTPLTYLCGHSLGLQPLAARVLLEQELDDWAHLAPGLAALTGAQPDEVVAMNSLTVNLHLMLASFYRPKGERRRILIEAGAFSSDRHAVASQIAWHGLDPEGTLLELTPRAGEDTVSEAAIEACLAAHGAQIALVLWPGVQFRTGQVFDLARIARAAHAHGCIAGFDLAHSIGNVPLALHAAEADFAVWCSYKYLNAGPGAIGGCFVHQRHAEAQPRSGHSGALPGARLAGWWGHEESTRFLMEPQFAAARGAASWAVSNPSVFAAAPLIASLAIFQEAGLAALRAKSLALSGYLTTLLEPLAPAVQIITPTAAAQRGCQLSLRIGGGATRGQQVFAALGARDIVVDWRTPDIIRVAPVPLYNGFEDAWRFAQALAAVLGA
jgi:kynureninase